MKIRVCGEVEVPEGVARKILAEQKALDGGSPFQFSHYVRHGDWSYHLVIPVRYEVPSGSQEDPEPTS